ncbi:Vegetative incompatibility HET-E-1 [Hyphodiscus hymeniophilus]|uniref:Vegetative incompatibility HET-E-1 n=1 Tax=Hyphodiscus hymeniophilus TaxID=353542 RepID=A0A9P6VDQ3_9HELO|nr:Vegetative incompatibility HET-E-1 [Hyphodiscus hymeniophilus]
MRLINTKTMRLEDFSVRKVPEYAILSHTWTEEEVTFHEITGQDDAFIRKAGFAKILKTCVLARANNIKYAWVDTCCIDKTSSAELTEAINSMFRWYRNASICYAYLSDLPHRKNVRKSVDQVNETDSTISYDELRVVEFYDENWTFRGTKADFAENIHRFTHIDQLVLQGGGQLTKLSIAERMTWASRRKTTRIEDTAYCLLGIFDINMPLLYGEGEKAFTRLQEEIIKNNSDLSIFGWSPEQSSAAAGPLGPRKQTVISVDWHVGFSDGCEVDCGHGDNNEAAFYSVLAPSPDEFVTPSDWDILGSTEHSVTNRGIKIYCRTKTTFFKPTHEFSWGIVLDKIGPDAFIRSRKRLILLDGNTKSFVSETRHRAIFLLTQAPQSTQSSTYVPLRIREGFHFIINSATPENRWNSATRSWYIENESPYEWGMVSLEFADLGNRSRVCVLFLGSSGQVFVLDPSTCNKEIGHISQSPSILTYSDVYEVFGMDNIRRKSREMSAEGQGLKVVARLGNPLNKDWAFEVWIEDSGTKKSSQTLHGSSAVHAAEESPKGSAKENAEIMSKALFKQLPAPKTGLPLAATASQWAVSASAATHSASGSIQAVILRCKIEERSSPIWSATRIRADHPVFSRPLLPIPALVEVPMVMHRLGTQSNDCSDLDNQVATWLNIAPKSGLAPAFWQDNVGTVIVARKDRKPLLPQHLEGMFGYCGRILDLFGNGDGAPTRTYNRAAFEKWWQGYAAQKRQYRLQTKERAEEEGRDGSCKNDDFDWTSVKSPFEV